MNEELEERMKATGFSKFARKVKPVEKKQENIDQSKTSEEVEQGLNEQKAENETKQEIKQEKSSKPDVNFQSKQEEKIKFSNEKVTKLNSH